MPRIHHILRGRLQFAGQQREVQTGHAALPGQEPEAPFPPALVEKWPSVVRANLERIVFRVRYAAETGEPECAVEAVVAVGGIVEDGHSIGGGADCSLQSNPVLARLFSSVREALGYSARNARERSHVTQPCREFELQYLARLLPVGSQAQLDGVAVPPGHDVQLHERVAPASLLPHDPHDRAILHKLRRLKRRPAEHRPEGVNAVSPGVTFVFDNDQPNGRGEHLSPVDRWHCSEAELIVAKDALALRRSLWRHVATGELIDAVAARWQLDDGS